MGALADAGRAACAPAAAILSSRMGWRGAWTRSEGFGGARRSPEQRNALASALLGAWDLHGEAGFAGVVEGVSVTMRMTSAPIPAGDAARRVVEIIPEDDDLQATLRELADAAGDLIVPPSERPGPRADAADVLVGILNEHALIGRRVRFSIPSGDDALSVVLESDVPPG